MVIAFRKVSGPYGWMSNMSPHALGEFKTAEHLFQCSRFPDGHKAIEEIKKCPSPMGAKMVAKKYLDEMVIQPRSLQDLDNMRLILACKLASHPHLEHELAGTEHQIIIEDVTARPNESGLFWGAALKKDATGSYWVGENRLGRLWMDIRKRLFALEASEEQLSEFVESWTS